QCNMFFFSSRRRHTIFSRDWSSDVCSSDLTKRTNFSLSGPLGGDFSFRMFGNLDKTQADAWDINQGHQSDRTGMYADTLPAGRRAEERRVGKERSAPRQRATKPHPTTRDSV